MTPRGVVLISLYIFTGETMASKPNAQSAPSEAQLLAGIQKNLATASFLIGGTTYTSLQVQQIVQQCANAAQASLSARKALTDLAKTNRQLQAQYQAFLRELRQVIQVMFSNAASTLADFGLAPRKFTKASPETLVAAHAKAVATRKARGTMGSKQKAKITGSSPPPAAASTSASTSSTPAPVAAPATPVVSPAAPPVTTPHA
jgi:hypothetical protein